MGLRNQKSRVAALAGKERGATFQKGVSSTRKDTPTNEVEPVRRIAIVGAVGIPAVYGGFETLVEHLTAAIGNLFELHVYCSSRNYSIRPRFYNNAQLHYVPLSANGVSSILYDMLSIVHALRYADTILVLGVSGSLLLPVVRRFSRSNVIVNVDGIEWRRQKWNVVAQYALRQLEKMAVRNATTVVSDNVKIAEYLAETYRVESISIAYGGDHAVSCRPTGSDVEKLPFLCEKYSVKVCRIEPENNVHIVLEAFCNLPEQQIAIVGNWADSEYGRTLFDKYGSIENIHLLEPIYDRTKLDMIRSSATLYIHGHSAGGTNPSLVEAMCLGLPVVAFDVGFNRETSENRAIYFRDAEALMRAVAGLNEEEARKIASDMHEIAMRRYTWKKISAEYSTLFAQ